VYFPIPNFYLHHGLHVLSVCVSVSLLANSGKTINQIFVKILPDVSVDEKKLVKFWKLPTSGSESRIGLDWARFNVPLNTF